MSKALIAQLLAQRESTCDLREETDEKHALRLRVRRPPETEWGRFLAKGVAMEAMRDIVIDYAIGWHGFTEADLMGDGIGNSDAVEFSRDLWAVVIADRADWVSIAFNHLLKLVNEYYSQREAAGKN